MVESFASDKHSSLLNSSVHYEEMECCEYGPRFSKIWFEFLWIYGSLNE
jgi:hypothetical protein